MSTEEGERSYSLSRNRFNQQLKTQRFTYHDDAIASMIGFLRIKREGDKEIISDEIEPFQLQLLCQYVERRILEEKQGADAQGMSIVNETDLGGAITGGSDDGVVITGSYL